MKKTYVVTVQYVDSPGRCYDFITDVPGLQKRDRVVVESVHGLGIAYVVEIKDESPKATAWVICKIDLVAHNKKVQARSELIALQKKMDAYVLKHGRRQQYEVLAANDTMMAQMLTHYDALIGGEEE